MSLQLCHKKILLLKHVLTGYFFFWTCTLCFEKKMMKYIIKVSKRHTATVNSAWAEAGIYHQARECYSPGATFKLRKHTPQSQLLCSTRSLWPLVKKHDYTDVKLVFTHCQPFFFFSLLNKISVTEESFDWCYVKQDEVNTQWV